MKGPLGPTEVHGLHLQICCFTLLSFPKSLGIKEFFMETKGWKWKGTDSGLQHGITLKILLALMELCLSLGRRT